MRPKILTVDDSRIVRTIVRKAFKPYDCEILEAENGVEGLAVATKDSPHLILLDVNMPVLDGIEMLRRLKADPALKNIPVIMLTTEGNRNTVLKIAQVGVRDYILQPLRPEALIEKCRRIIDLKPLGTRPAKARTVFDPVDILVVADEPARVQQIQAGLQHTPWTVRRVSTHGEAIDACRQATPDLIVISLSLPEESRFLLFRSIRAHPTTNDTPIFGLAGKTETAQLQQAQSLGFTALLTMPIDAVELEAQMAQALNLDTSPHYYAIQGSQMILRLPAHCPPAAIAEMGAHLKPKLTEAIDAGLNQLVIDLRLLRSPDLAVIKFLCQAKHSSRELDLHVALVGSAQSIAECRGFEHTSDWTFYESLDEALHSLGAPEAAAPAPMPELSSVS